MIKLGKNKYIWLIVLVVGIAVVGGIYFYSTNNSNNNGNGNYQAERTSTNSTDKENSEKDESEKKEPEYIEETISTFSTKIYDADSSRQNNINITCGILDSNIVKNGETFSFCSAVGPSTTDKGYQKAKIFDSKGNVKQGLGGGNCQISTTLYNAVLNVPELSVTERHAHSSYVPYIQKGKDAAVAYGSYDFKFVNNTGNDVVIHCSSNGSTIDVSLASKKVKES